VTVPATETLRMKDLCAATGLERQAIHFYIKEGLLPPGRKTGRNTAVYGPEHVERLRLIRQLQHERFLPLKAIRALLDEKDDSYSPEQKRLLAEVRERLTPLVGSVDPGPALPAAPILERVGLSRADLDEMVAAGVLHTHADADGAPTVATTDVWMLELFGAMRAAGFTRELGFTAHDLAMYPTAIGQLFQAEKRLLADRLSALPPDQIAAMVERALPVVHQLITRYHLALVRNMFTKESP
jgi:DNA-binding transcriptional MerR regulator